MTRGGKIWTVATFEFLTTVKRPGYLIATFGMPLFVALYAGIVAIPAYYSEMKDRADTVYGVVDQAGVLGLTEEVRAPTVQIDEEVRRTIDAMGQGAKVDAHLASSNFIFRPYDNEAEARAGLQARTIRGYYLLPPDYMVSGRVNIYAPDAVRVSGPDARNAFANLARERLLASRLDERTRGRVLRPVADPRRYSISRTGETTEGGQTAFFVRLAIPMVFIVLFLMSVLMTAGYLLQGTAVEKENKVVEVLLASANPDEILGGKLLGLGAAGLLQIAVWLLMALVTGIGIVPYLIASGVRIPWLVVALAVPLFIISFLFFGSLILGTGSIGSNMREAQQMAMVWSLTAAMPLMLLTVIIREPSGTVARVMTWIPFSSASMLMLRAGMDPASLAWWEIAGAIAVLLLSTRIAIAIGARLFRVGLLSSGSRPSLREVVRQARLAQ